jgi:NADH-quinone oxidoreductase subunit N
MIAVAIIALLNTVVAYYYYVRVLKNLYLVKIDNQESSSIRVSFGNIIIILILLIPVMVFGIYFTPLVNLAQNSISLFGF